MEKINKSNKEKNNKKKRRKNKLKRQISLFTIMLWVFLISTMITITVNSTKKTNALEVEDENWNISLVMYNRSSDTPTEAITEFTWNAESSSETKQLCMQINYACTTNKGYQPGEIEITIPGFGKSGSEYNKSYYPNVTIAADKVSDTTKKYDWSYNYYSENNIYTFINNGTIEENEHFEGTIQIVYNLEPKFKIQTDLVFVAKIRENIENAEEILTKESNICDFHYTATKKTYPLNIHSRAAYKADYSKIENILDDYYWVRYLYDIKKDNTKLIGAYGEKENRLIGIDANNKCIKTTLPEGCILYNSKFDKVEPTEGNQYYYLYGTEASNLSEQYYIGYPKTKYNEGDIVTNIAEVWGRYEDELEMQKLSENSSTVKLVNFDFEYKGDAYVISKIDDFRHGNLNLVKNEGETFQWHLFAKVFYKDKFMDVEIGDDLIYITRENGEVTKLNDDEYNFTKIEIPVFYIYNKYTGKPGDALIGYNYEMQVRYKDTNEYVVYKDGVTINKAEYIEFNRDDIVGLKIIIKDLDKSIYSLTSSYAYSIDVSANIHTKDVGVGRIYNFDYLQVYEKDESGNKKLANEVTIDSYNTPSTLKIAEYDMNMYGKYMQRSYAGNSSIESGWLKLYQTIVKDFNVVNIPKDEKYTIDYNIYSGIDLHYYDVDKDCIIKQYEILPNGINLISSKEEIVDSLLSDLPYENLELKDGNVFESKEEFEDYIKENTTIDIDYNYRDSGRTKISIMYNLNGIDWSYYVIKSFSRKIGVKIKVELSYDSIIEYGTVYKDYTYAMWNNQEYDLSDNGYILTGIIQDNGQYDNLASDIDNDGDTEESIVHAPNTLNITHAVSSQQAVIKQVRTDLTKGKFIEGTAEATSGSEYTYKLRVTTGANSLKDLILYDTLETIYDESGNDTSSGWNGKFLGVDTSYAESKGYAPKVYYSEEKNPGKLTEVPDKWLELTDDVDKSTVKSICVDLRYKADGSEMELSANNVVFVLINMQVPEDDSILTSANNMFSTNWRAIDPLGTVIDNIEGIYSNQVNVEIHKEDIRTNISGTKTWDDEDDKRRLRPESITVKLLQDGQEYESKTVTAENNWNYTFENVPVYASNTREYVYEIVEDEVENYKTTYDGYNITNSINLIDIEAEKLWDEEDKVSIPKSLTLKLFNKGKLISEAGVSEESEWKHTFTNLPKYNEDGTEIDYKLEEGMYETSRYYYCEHYDKFILKNIFLRQDQTASYIIEKKWEDNNDEAGKRPDNIKVKIRGIGFDASVDEVELNKWNDWNKEVYLLISDRYGNDPEYSDFSYLIKQLEEQKNEFYTSKIVYGDKEVNGTTKVTIVNTFEVPNHTKSITASKIWDDNNNVARKRPESITLQVKDGERVVASHVVSEEDEWKYTFELPKYDSLGNEIIYTVDEEYTNKFYIKEIVGNTITNRFVVPEDKIKVVGTKVWDDSEDFAKKRPDSVILQVIANNEVITEHEVNEANNWSYEFELAKYDKYGNEIEYYIDERDVGSKFYEKELTNTTTVTNKFKVPDEKINLEVMKTWDDNNNEARKRPESITLQVKSNGVIVAEQVVSDENNWRYTFELPKYNETGDVIEYTVDEKELDEEVSKFYVKNIVGLTITNKFVVPEDRVKIVGTKVWNDNGNAGGKRDTSVTLQLKVKEYIIAEAEVSDSNNWNYEFEAPKYDELGNELEYYIDERNSDNKFYKKTLTNKNTVTNEFVVPEEKILVKAVKKWEDNNNEYSKRPESVVLQVYDKDKLIAEEKVSAENNWSYEFKLPKYDEYGDEIKYTVDEKSTSKYYEKSVEGYTIINKCIYEPVVDTSDMNIFVYVVIFFIAIIGIISFIFVRKNSLNKKA